MLPHIVYIHGANSTPKSFSYLEQHLPPHTKAYITYNASERLKDTIASACEEIDRPCHLIGHSLGGVIAVSISQMLGSSLVRTVSTISSPFGGSETADKMSMFMPFNTFFRNIKTTSPLLRGIQQVGTVVPTLSIITTGGHSPLEPKRNDGVVTVESQLTLKDNLKLHVPYTHFEVLLDEGVAKTIATFMLAHHNLV